ncbi:MAG: selenocysteine-specific translation elongation factor [Candidatus Zixiibacteriota bacterium]
MGTAGHVDHGKSTLVMALSGIDPDRLPEEKARGMTIDLGFAWVTTKSGETIGIVDVPGHERFVKNMIAGVGAIDFVLLVIAADDGWMPQSAEHLAILRFLGVRRGIVVITKIGLVERDWLELVKADVRDHVAGAFPDSEPPAIVPVDSVTGEGLDDLRDAIDAMTRTLSPRRDIGKPRLYIDRVFAVAGRGVVVTGTLIDGALSVGQSVVLVPGAGNARVRELQVHKRGVTTALPGQRVAVNLAGADSDNVKRGQCLVMPTDAATSDRLWGQVRILPDATHPLERQRQVLVMLGTVEPDGIARPVSEAHIEPGQEGFCEFHLRQPIKARLQDRFVLRWPTPGVTIGGGIILDLGGDRRAHRDPDLLRRLQLRRDGTIASYRRTELGKRGFASRAGFLDEGPFTASEIAADLDQALQRGDVAESRGWLFDAAWLADSRRQLVGILALIHHEQPYLSGLNLAAWQARARIPAEPMPALADWLSSSGEVARTGDAYHLPGHQAALPADWNGEAERLWKTLIDGGMLPPTREDLESRTEHARAILGFWISTGRVLALGDGVILTTELYAAVREKVREALRTQPSLTAGQLRDLLGTTRRYAVPIGEALDREGITRRVGDVRVLAEEGLRET